MQGEAGWQHGRFEVMSQEQESEWVLQKFHLLKNREELEDEISKSFITNCN
jgi:hypothetical protein